MSTSPTGGPALRSIVVGSTTAKRAGREWPTGKRIVNNRFYGLHIFEGGLEPAGGVSSVQMGVGVGHSPMDKTLIGFNFRIPGWRGDMVEAWRGARLSSVTYALTHHGHAYRDWMCPFVEFDNGLLRNPAWGEFWLYLIDKCAASRQWMRWAHSFAQQFRKVTPGSVGDMQLSSYFFETDVVVTADKALIDILEECRPYAPCKLPEGKVVAGGAPGVAEVLRLLDS